SRRSREHVGNPKGCPSARRARHGHARTWPTTRDATRLIRQPFTSGRSTGCQTSLLPSRVRGGSMRTAGQVRKAARAKARRARAGTQLELGMRERLGHGGRRKGAGRKGKKPRKGGEHLARPHRAGRTPILDTIRVAAYVASLRSAPCFGVVLGAMKAAAERFGARIVAYSVLNNHIHLVMGAADRTSLSRALIGLNTRIGKGINQITGTRGR